MTPPTRIYVAGGNTLVGKALIERLREGTHGRLVGVPPHEPDLTSMSEVDRFFADTRPDWVLMAAGLSEGIQGNVRRPADLMVNNLLVSTNVLAVAARSRVKKLLYLGSACMYPKLSAQPMRPDMLQTGPLESTSVAYAAAKLAGVTLCQAYRQQNGAPFIAAIPANAFGPGDSFCAESGHVIPALVRRMHEAKLRRQDALEIWGTGSPRRDFIFAADLAEACLVAMNRYDDSEPINLGSGREVTIAEIAQLIAEVVDYRGMLRFDHAKPDGAPRKSLDSSKLFALGWRPATPLRTALQETYAWFKRQWQRPEEAYPVRVAV